MRSSILRPAAALTILVSIGNPCAAQCVSAWSTQFGNLKIDANDMLVHDDGTGPALYFTADSFSTGGGGVGRWRGPGTAVEVVGGANGINGVVSKLAVYDDGTGPALYATGNFLSAGASAMNRMAKWNGTSWTPLGSGIDASGYALTVYNDGTGPALWVGGSFSNAGGVPAPRLARWNGTSWSSPITAIFGTAANPTLTIVWSLASYDPGTGPRLYMIGQFSQINGVLANSIASFDGSVFAPLGTGVVAYALTDSNLAVYDDGTGPQLYAGGIITNAGGVAVNNIARWNGSAWSPLGSGINGKVQTFTVWNLPSGPHLAVGGGFTNAGGTANGGIALWNGTNFISANAIGRSALSLAVFDPGTGPKLYVSGGLMAATGPTSFTGESTGVFQSYDGFTWASPTGQGVRPGSILSLASHDDGTGRQLYAAGGFANAGGTPAAHVARWNGASWSAAGAGLYTVNAIHSIASGLSAGLYGGGNPELTTLPLVFGARVYQWNGTAWTQLGPVLNNAVRTLSSTAGTLLVGGDFTASGTTTLNYVAMWNGAAWAPLGSGVGGPVNVFTTFDDGFGPALYVGGTFPSAGGVPASSIAKWNGAAWTPVGTGVTGSAATVWSLEVFDDGTGPALYAGGEFTAAGGVPAMNVAKWNGAAWSPLGSGVTAPMAGSVGIRSLKTFNDGTGAKLYAGGFFWTAGGSQALRIASWDGSTWASLGSGVDQVQAPGTAVVNAIESIDLGYGPTLFAGGLFNTAGGNNSLNIAELRPPRPGLALYQPGGPGTGVVVANLNLTPGGKYYNIFSTEPAPGGLGTGPYLGLYASNPAVLFAQLALGLNTPPFHFVAPTAAPAFGPFPVPAFTVIEGVCFDVSTGNLGCVSVNAQLVVY